MTLRSRIRWLLILSTAACVLVALLALGRVNHGLLAAMHQEAADRELSVVEAAFLDQLSVLRVRAEDWSRQPDYPPGNLGGIGQLDLMISLDGHQLGGTQGMNEAALPAFERLAVRFEEDGCFPIWGVVQVNGRPLLFSTAVEQGCQAYLLGIWLDSHWLAYLSDRVGHALYVRPVPEGLPVERDLIEAGEAGQLGRFPIPEYFGGQPLEVVVELPDDSLGMQNTAVAIMGIILGVLAGITVAGVYWRIQSLLFGRLGSVHNAVRSIARGGTLDQRVPVLGNDEIGELAEDFNAMVDSIDHAQTQLASARRQAEVASKTKSQFLANMSHEIRTPMTAILGYAELLREGRGSDQERQHYLNIIQQNGDALLALINDVLDLSRIEAGQLHREESIFSVPGLLDDIVESFRLRAAEKGLELALIQEDELPAALNGDVFRLRQIVVNLVGNALKFTEQGAIQIYASWHSDAQRLQIRVEDTGIGISETQLQTIFQPFTQADVSHTRRYMGSGLGLSIARELARAQGGDIRVVSNSRGSCFTLEMPFEIASGEVSSSAPVVASGDQTLPSLRGRALLVEDNQVNRLLVKTLLERAGMSVVEAENGQQACDRYQEDDGYALVVLDMQMPVMDGYQTVRTLRAKGFAGPVLALTANVLAVDRQRCLDAGCDAFMGKPVRSRELLLTCADLLDQSLVEL